MPTKCFWMGSLMQIGCRPRFLAIIRVGQAGTNEANQGKQGLSRLLRCCFSATFSHALPRLAGSCATPCSLLLRSSIHHACYSEPNLIGLDVTGCLVNKLNHVKNYNRTVWGGMFFYLDATDRAAWPRRPRRRLRRLAVRGRWLRATALATRQGSAGGPARCGGRPVQRSPIRRGDRQPGPTGKRQSQHCLGLGAPLRCAARLWQEAAGL